MSKRSAKQSGGGREYCLSQRSTSEAAESSRLVNARREGKNTHRVQNIKRYLTPALTRKNRRRRLSVILPVRDQEERGEGEAGRKILRYCTPRETTEGGRESVGRERRTEVEADR